MFKFLGSLIVILASLALIAYIIISMLPDVLMWADMGELMGFHFYFDCAGVTERVRTAALLTLTGAGAVVAAGVLFILTFSTVSPKVNQ